MRRGRILLYHWFQEQQRMQKMGGKIVSVKLVTGKLGMNTGLA